MDAEARLGGQVVDAVDAREEGVLLAGRVAKPREHLADLRGIADQAGLAVLVVGAGDGVRMRLVQVGADELEAGCVRHARVHR